MPAAYDKYDYPQYWEGRKYEHESEILAMKAFVSKIKKLDKIVEIGSGYGRLVPSYEYRAKRVILVDPSSKLLKIARKNFDNKKYKFIHSKLENMGNKVKVNSVDLVILVRVLHHIEDIDEAFRKINKLLKNGGYFILEYPNKKHIKAIVMEFLKGNLTFAFDIFPKDRQSDKSCCLPFKNYHPDVIKEKLNINNFKVIQRRSVSNIRNDYIKRLFPLEVLIAAEKLLQIPLSFINFGPSVMILSKKA
jgi:ubiquinone/menaquinone biosynthesis C-methylase UbiE